MGCPLSLGQSLPSSKGFSPLFSASLYLCLPSVLLNTRWNWPGNGSWLLITFLSAKDVSVSQQHYWCNQRMGVYLPASISLPDFFSEAGQAQVLLLLALVVADFSTLPVSVHLSVLHTNNWPVVVLPCES